MGVAPRSRPFGAVAFRPEEILHTLVQRMGEALGIQHCACIFATPGQDEGRLVAEGTPEEVARNEASATGRFLAAMFAAEQGRPVRSEAV